MKKLLIVLCGLSSANAVDMYAGSSVEVDNKTGITQPTFKFNLHVPVSQNITFSNYSKYYFDLNSDQRNHTLDNNSTLKIAYGNSGFYSMIGYRGYIGLTGTYKDRQELKNGFAFDLAKNASNHSYFTMYRYSDNAFKYVAGNDFTYKFTDKLSGTLGLAFDMWSNANPHKPHMTLDATVGLTYLITPKLPITIQQEMVRNLQTNVISDSTMIEIGYKF